MKQIVGVGDMRVSSAGGDLIVTHALGSCLGITVYDPAARVGGLLHAMLPNSTLNPEKAKANPSMFVDTGVPALVNALLAAGADKGRLAIKVAGGSTSRGGQEDRFAIGSRNYLTLKKTLWRNNLMLDAEDVGGEAPRTMYLEIGSGRVWLSLQGREEEL